MAKRRNDMSLGEAIEVWLQSAGLKEKALIQRVIGDWERIMGKPIAENTERLHFKDGVFHIHMRHPVWRQELILAQGKIREMLNRELGAELVKEVRVQ